ncbi:beta-1,3-glucanase family protein [Actinomadura nitritigenes]|uniref:beta-1,3-glucanase family protein n=1 Tax=Actinomadura nitritigenes TaxID=134602 RepID=UPI003D91FABC
MRRRRRCPWTARSRSAPAARRTSPSGRCGYAFQYDDVCPDGQPDVSGAASDGDPRRLTVSVG